jgi:hypothetical protein
MSMGAKEDKSSTGSVELLDFTMLWAILAWQSF